MSDNRLTTSKQPELSQPGASSEPKAPRVVLVGCGAIAEQYYLPALAKHPAVAAQLVLADPGPGRAEAMARKFGFGTYVADYHQVLGNIDGAIVAVPTHLHHPVTADLLGAGAHVLCEKPLADSAEKGADLVAKAAERGVTLSVNYQRRLFPCLSEVKRLLQEGNLGAPLEIEYRVAEPFDWPTVSGFYFNAVRSSRGVLRDRGAHTLDTVCWWLGGKPSVIASRNDSFGGSEAVAMVDLSLDRCRAVVHLSWLGKSPSRFSVRCENGSVSGEEYEWDQVTVREANGRVRRIKPASDLRTYADISDAVITRFVGVAGGRAQPLVTGGDVLPSLELIDDCYRAAQAFDLPWYRELEPADVH